MTVLNSGDKDDLADEPATEFATEETGDIVPETFATEDNRQAIFFRLPTTQQSEQFNSDFSLNSRIRFKDDTFSNDDPSTQNSTNLDYVSNSKITFKQPADTNSDLLTSENVRHTTNLVRFPENHESIPHNSQIQHPPHEHHNPFNHRNRDKDFWQLKHNWREVDGTKSFLLKLSNINLSDILVQNRHSAPMYRQIPAEHLSYIFGRNNNRR